VQGERNGEIPGHGIIPDQPCDLGESIDL